MTKKTILERLIREDIELLDELVGWWLETGRTWPMVAVSAWDELIATGLVEFDEVGIVRPTKYGIQWIKSHRVPAVEA